MTPIRRKAVLAILAVAMTVSLTVGGARPAAAAPGDLVADVLVPEADPVWTRGLAPSVAFDGRYLYYLDYAGSVLHRIDVPPAGSAGTGTGHVDAPVAGAPTGIMTIAYDAGRDLFWAIGGDGLSIYRLSKNGMATLAFRVDPVDDRPGFQAGPAPTEVKIAYDRADDTLWYAPDATTRVYHYGTSADLLGSATLVSGSPYFDVNVTAQCGYNQTSGVAVGGANLFISVAGCPYYFEYAKNGTQVAAYPINFAGQQSTQDVECDDLSYGVPVFWIKDGYDGHIRAFEQPRSGACIYGGGTGSGGVTVPPLGLP
jgi:catechol 2,3-dioxygenase-like lactoylglutathione lyase family enzyme